MEPNFWRATTDNDFGAKSPKTLTIWKQATKNQVLKDIKFFKDSKEIEFKSDKKIKDEISGEEVDYYLINTF